MVVTVVVLVMMVMAVIEAMVVTEVTVVRVIMVVMVVRVAPVAHISNNDLSSILHNRKKYCTSGKKKHRKIAKSCPEHITLMSRCQVDCFY